MPPWFRGLEAERLRREQAFAAGPGRPNGRFAPARVEVSKLKVGYPDARISRSPDVGSTNPYGIIVRSSPCRREGIQ